MTASDVRDLEDSLRKEFPGFVLLPKKESVLMRLINTFLLIVTIGLYQDFMKTFCTTIGRTLYTPSNWDEKSPAAQAINLRHEAVHMRQQVRYGRIWYSFLYLFVLPIGFCFWRRKFEMEAYEETLQATHDYGGNVLDPNVKAGIVKQFIGPSYLWMWPFKEGVLRWYDEVTRRILWNQ